MYRIRSYVKGIKITAKLLAPLMLLVLQAGAAMAQNNGPRVQSISQPLVTWMLIIMIILLMAIALVANVLVGAASWKLDREKQEEKEASGSKSAATIATIIGLLLFSPGLMAQTETAIAETTKRIGGLSPTAFYFMTGVVLVELIVLLVLVLQLRLLLARRKAATAATAPATQKTRTSFAAWWARFNKFKPVEEESKLDLGHDYDGIRELDNRLPPWWLYGFYVTIVFAAIYLWRHHVSHTAPSSEQEFQIAMAKAAKEKEAYLKKAANLVDENTVKLLTDASDLAAGKKIYTVNCAPCHGNAGEGSVGPNLTDDYWLHGGSVQSIFKTIKYGVPEKGMKSWKEDLSPAQMAQVTSYIKSLRGTNPPNPKEHQGVLYIEEESENTGAAQDSTAAAAAN
jgi:Cytochrome c, mono- and diheme variants